MLGNSLSHHWGLSLERRQNNTVIIITNLRYAFVVIWPIYATTSIFGINLRRGKLVPSGLRHDRSRLFLTNHGLYLIQADLLFKNHFDFQVLNQKRQPLFISVVKLLLCCIQVDLLVGKLWRLLKTGTQGYGLPVLFVSHSVITLKLELIFEGRPWIKTNGVLVVYFKMHSGLYHLV